MKSPLKINDRILIAILGVIIGISLVLVTQALNGNFRPEPEAGEMRLGLHGFINPILDCSPTLEGYGFQGYDLEKNLNGFIDKLLSQEKDVKSVSMYFKDLNNGPVIGINADLPMLGGSLIKVPLIIGHLKTSEMVPGYLGRTIKYSKELSNELYKIQEIDPAQTLQQGKAYTIDELIQASIVHSDNVAAVLLENYESKKALEMVVKEMDISISSRFPPYRDMTIRNYAGLFRILYNATYLNRENSSKALELLSQVSFKEGLRHGVPSDVLVAHKYGEKTVGDSHEIYFNDCGIIYHPKKPYLLCISTLGMNRNKQILMIEKISGFVFNEIDTIFE